MAKRLTSSSVNWSLAMEMLPSEVFQRFMPLKMASDKYLREISQHPPELPKIDWASYKNKITVPGMIDSFMKEYEGLKIPYPSDQGKLAEADQLNAQILKTVENNVKEMSERNKELKETLKKLESIMKLSEMTIEELFLAKPELRIGPDNLKLFPYFIPDPPSIKKEEH